MHQHFAAVLVLTTMCCPALATNITATSSLAPARSSGIAMHTSLYYGRPLFTDTGQPIPWYYGVSLLPKWQLTPRWSVFLFTDMRYHRQVEEEANHVQFPSDGAIGTKYFAPISDSTSLGMTGRAIVPVDKERQQQQAYQGGVSIDPHVSISLPSLLKMQQNLTFGVEVLKNFHSYETAENGESNTSYESSAHLRWEGQADSFLSLSVLGQRLWQITYNGTQQDLYAITSEIRYFPWATLSTGIGHVHKSHLLSADQRTSNLSLTSRNRSVIYGILAYAIAGGRD